ncbi:MAG TPA: hypothetical protein VMU21_03560 [Thermodesulfovibrionales bacterium]|nr:hypothetical protein [Thermodesulfovibrionales bacterium]
MGPLSKEFVEKTWQEVSGFTPARVDKEMLNMGKNQPDLLAFLMAYTDDLQQEVKELAIYIAFVVYKMFLDSSGKIPRISSGEIMARYNENERFLGSLQEAHEQLIEKIVDVEVFKQPYVTRYVLEALTEDAEEDDIRIAEEDIGFLLILFKTEIEVLDKKA